MSLTTRVLLGLVAGFLFGLGLGALPGGLAGAVIAFVTPVGVIFVNLIRMTVLPLVVSMLVAAVGSIGATGELMRVAVKAAVAGITLVVIATVFTIVAAKPILDRVQIDQSAALALGGPGATTTAPVTPSQFVIDLVPSNVFKATSDGAMLPVIVFSVLFGIALAGIAAERRDAVLGVARGIADAMQRLVGGILELAPIGVFALAVPLASKLGLAAAGAVLAYIALVVTLTVVVAVALLYPIGVIAGGMSLKAFIEYSTPAQAVAFASRSSLAALPAMIESAERSGMPPVVSRLVLPMAASVSRVGAAVALPVGVLFLARLYGVSLTSAQLASVAVTVMLTTFAVAGVPGGSILAMVPVLAAVRLPIEGIGILLAVDTIPDMFRTTANVTGSLAMAAALRRGEIEERR